MLRELQLFVFFALRGTTPPRHVRVSAALRLEHTTFSLFGIATASKFIAISLGSSKTSYPLLRLYATFLNPVAPERIVLGIKSLLTTQERMHDFSAPKMAI